MEVMDLHINCSLLDTSVVLSDEEVEGGLAPSFTTDLEEEEY
jgi:hypothetical protein